MKCFLSISLLLGLAPAAFAQSVALPKSQWFAPAPRPHVTFVETTPAPNPGSVEVRGFGLDLVTGARVNGAEVPILAQNRGRLVLDVPPQIPGFGELELLQPQSFQRARIEFTPSLAGRYDAGAARVQLRLNPGHPGWYLVNFSFQARNEMLVFPGAYYGEMLDMDSPYSGVLFSGLMTGEPMVFPWFDMPRVIIGVGDLGITWGRPGSFFGTTRPLRIQALCGGGDLCYSNMLTLQATL
ncbi:MAG TPA: hypothetical protein VF530_20330 [Planctomycetota bacterium]